MKKCVMWREYWRLYGERVGIAQSPMARGRSVSGVILSNLERVRC